jgi:hypothetical protein
MIYPKLGGIKNMLNHIDIQDFSEFTEDISENFLEKVGGVENLSNYTGEDLEEAVFSFIDENYFEHYNAPGWIDLDVLVSYVIRSFESK